MLNRRELAIDLRGGDPFPITDKAQDYLIDRIEKYGTLEYWKVDEHQLEFRYAGIPGLELDLMGAEFLNNAVELID